LTLRHRWVNVPAGFEMAGNSTEYERGFRDAFELRGIDLQALKASRRYLDGYIQGHRAARKEIAFGLRLHVRPRSVGASD